jgi:glycine/sarcosine N-methyltransferase
MKFEVRDAYDSLANDYHLMYLDWAQSVRRQGELISRVISEASKQKKDSILDCSCGVGTQAIGLALKGYQVSASDLSPKSIDQARRNAKKFKVKLKFAIADFRELALKVPGSFDVVVSCDNSLPHLLTERDILRAAKNIRAKLQPQGFFLLGIRDYDKILMTRPLGTIPLLMKEGKWERIYIQSWTWVKNSPIYKFRLFLLRGSSKDWKVKSVEAKYRAWKRQELSDLMLKAGFSSVRWLMPKKTQLHQPLALIRF